MHGFGIVCMYIAIRYIAIIMHIAIRYVATLYVVIITIHTHVSGDVF